MPDFIPPNWTHNPKASAFFRDEAEAMAKKFPQFQPSPSQNFPNAIAWTGFLATNYGNRYLIEVVHADSFPFSPPFVFVLQPRIRAGAPHLYVEGSLCLHPQSWTPYRSSAINVISAAAEWLLLYDHWLATGKRW